MTGYQLLGHAAEPARVDRVGIELPVGIGAEQDAHQEQREIGVLGVAPFAVGQTVQQVGELGDDFGVERGQALPQLRPSERRDGDLGEEDAARPVGGKLDEQELQAARQCTLGIQDVQLGTQRRPELLEDRVDGRDQQVFLRVEVVVHEAGGHVGLGGDALHRGPRDAVLQNRRPEPVDDLAPSRSGETGSSHR